MRVRVGLVSVCLAGAACGGSSPTSYGGNTNSPPPPPTGSQVANVNMIDNAFSPATMTVKVGTPVKWTNTGTASHTATSDPTPPPSWNSGTVAPAGMTSCSPNDPYCQPGTTPPGTYTWTFTTAGTYQYHCQFHQQQGMTGTITVTP